MVSLNLFSSVHTVHYVVTFKLHAVSKWLHIKPNQTHIHPSFNITDHFHFSNKRTAKCVWLLRQQIENY